MMPGTSHTFKFQNYRPHTMLVVSLFVWFGVDLWCFALDSVNTL